MYLAGKTVVNIKVNWVLEDNLPALTLCYPHIFSMEKASHFNKTYKQLFDEYKKHQDHYYINDTAIDKNVEAKLNELYERANSLTSNETIYTLLNNLSIDYLNYFDNDLYRGFPVYLDGLVDRNDSSLNKLFKFYLDDSQMVISDPLESIDILHKRKCFTFFSALESSWRNFKMGLKMMNIDVRHNRLSFPSMDESMVKSKVRLNEKRSTDQVHFKKIYLFMHSPNSLPAFNEDFNYIEVEPDRDYTIKYSKLKINRLDSRYDTNCNEYDLDHKFANFNMASDCISSCHQAKMFDICNSTGLKNFRFLYRKQYFDYEQTTKINTECTLLHKSKLMKIKLDCNNICKHDCHHTYYHLDHYSEKKYFRSYFNPSIISMITIRHNSFS